MFYEDMYTIERRMHMRVEEELRQAEAGRRKRLLTPQSEGSLLRRGGGLACRMGKVLVALGAWLEQYGLRDSLKLEGQAGATR